MAANLRRGNLPTADTMARFLYYVIKQLDVRGVDWTEVSENMGITNGHAARMRFARYKNQVEGIAPKPREPRAPGAKQKGPGRPVKKQKLEKKEEGDENVKKEADAPNMGGDGKVRIKREGSEGGREGSVEGGMPQVRMGGSLGPGAGIKREFSDIDADGEETGTDNLNPMDLTTRTGSTSSNTQQPQSRKGSVKVKSEPTEDGASSRRTSNSAALAEARGETDAPGESIDASELDAMSLQQSTSPQTTLAQPTSGQNSPHANSPHLALSQPQEQPSPQNVPFTMQHLQLSHHSNTPPASYQVPTSSDGGINSSQGQGGYAHLNVSTYPTPAYFSQPMQAVAGQSPATTNSSAAFSLPPSPSTNGAFQEMNYGMAGQGMNFDMGHQTPVHNGMMINQGGFVDLLEDPSFPRQQGQYFGGNNGGYGGWEGMY